MKRKPLLMGLGLLVIVLVCAAYLGDYYPADREQIEAFASEISPEPYTAENGCLVFGREDAGAGLIFYPGGKVEHTAYIPLMQSLASEEILCVLVEMPFRLAVLDVNAADGIRERYPQVENWYMAGHSLGGSMAAAYLEDRADAFDGLILLGAYSTADLSETDLSVLSIYGSEDLVMNREKYEQNREHLPEDFSEAVLEGGCHAYFGMYGPQEGDGIPSITNEEQIAATTELVAKLTE